MTRHPLVELLVFRMKEFRREPAVLFWAIFFPLVMMVVLGLAFRPREAPKLAVLLVVPPGDEYAQNMQKALDAFELDQGLDADGKPDRTKPLRVIAKPTREEALLALTRGDASLLIEPVKASVPIYRYDKTHPESRTAHLLADAALRDYLVPAGAQAPALRPAAQEKIDANGSRYIDWFVPGMLGMSIMNGSLWGLGFALVEMRAKKLLKRFAVTPMSRSHFLGAQAVGRMLVVALQATVMLVFSYFAFGVEVKGSLLAFALVAAVGNLTFGGIGLLVGSRVRNTEVAAGIMNIPMLPMIFLSGVFFSASNFPDVVQPLIRSLPLTALIDAFRRIANEGGGLESVWKELVVLVVWCVGTMIVALRIFKWS